MSLAERREDSLKYELREKSEHVAQLAEKIGVRLVMVESDFRDLFHLKSRKGVYQDVHNPYPQPWGFHMSVTVMITI